MKQQFLVLALLLLAQISFSQCYEDRHNTSWNDAWISCEASPNPNSLRGNSHWIRYSINHLYSLGQITYWNYNDPANLDRGLNEIAIDYSLDGIEWIEFGTFTLDRSEGSSFYEGSDGPDLNGLQAKDILITAISNHGGDCFALSEIKFEVLELVSNKDVLELDVNITLSPVPTKDILNVEISSTSIQGKINYSIVGMQGKLFQAGSFLKNGPSITESLNLSALAAGQYVIELSSKDASKAKSFNIIK